MPAQTITNRCCKIPGNALPGGQKSVSKGMKSWTVMHSIIITRFMISYHKRSNWQKIARPRFELGSKAPKASMLGHYIRQNFHSSTGLPGVFSVYILPSLECYVLISKNESILCIGSSIFSRMLFAILLCFVLYFSSASILLVNLTSSNEFDALFASPEDTRYFST